MSGTFQAELQQRYDEALASLSAARHLGDALLAQIAEGDVADLEALARRNEVELVVEEPASKTVG